MKKTLLLVLSIFSFAIAFGQSNIFFSQYAEGSSNNKFLEIYNASDEVVDLTLYAYPNSNNDPDVVGEYDYWNTFDEGASVAPGDVYVISHGSADDAILAEADENHTYLSNGDDGFKLVYGTEDSFVVVDAIGDWQADPGQGWTVAGVENATKDHTLVRKSSVTAGNPDWTASAGTTADDSEWIVLDQDDWTGLGSHTMDGPSVDPDCSFDVLMADAGGYPGEITWTITNAAGETVLSGAGTDTDTQVLEMSYGETYTLNMADEYGDGWNGGILSVGGTEYTIEDGASATGSIVCEDPTPPTCEHTFVMNDAYGDGWNGNTVDLSVGGVVIAEAITAANAGGGGNPSTEAYAFSAEEGSSITLSNWTEGSWTSEVSWSILDGTGVELASGLFGDVADVVANCTPAACPAPQVTAWSMTDTGVEFDGTNQESILSYTVEYSEEMFTPGDGTAMTYSFDSFPASLDGLTPATTYYFAMVANCAEGLTSDYIGGPDEWTTNVAAPDNDLCENAIPLVDGEAVAGTTNGATDDGERPSGDVWYSYTATNADEVTITTCGSELDTVLYVYDACDGELVTSNDDDSACDSSGLNSTVTFANDGVTTYYVMIEAYSGSGDFTVSVESTLGVEDNQIDDLRIYPNPVSDNYVTIVTSLSGDKFVELFDVNGRKVLETTINGNTLDVSSINSGFYMLKVTMNGQSNVSKLIVR